MTTVPAQLSHLEVTFPDGRVLHLEAPSGLDWGEIEFNATCLDTGERLKVYGYYAEEITELPAQY